MNKEYRNCYIRASFSDLHFQNQIERTTFYCSVVELFHRTLIVTWYVIYQVYTWYILKKMLQYPVESFTIINNTELYSEDVNLMRACVCRCVCMCK